MAVDACVYVFVCVCTFLFVVPAETSGSNKKYLKLEVYK